MYKIIQSNGGFYGTDEPVLSHIDLHNNHFAKFASKDSEITKFAKSLRPREDGIYVHINAVGGSKWGSNINGDYFDSDMLSYECPKEAGVGMGGTVPRQNDYGHKTFEKYAFAYKFHVNKDPKTSISQEKVAFSHYNQKMDRVELIVFIKRDRDPELVKGIENGVATPVSMGTYVPYDVCSFCGNKAKTPASYCDHLKFQMNQIMPDGQKVYAINPYPRFFDISFVLVPADKTSYVMKKVASTKAVIPSAFIASALGIEEPKVSIDKSAEILKEVPVDSNVEKPDPDVIKAFSDMLPRIGAMEPDLDDVTMHRISQHPLSDILSTVTSLGMVLKPHEFSKIIIIQGASGDQHGDMNICPSHVNKDVAGDLQRHVVDRSSYRQPLRIRLINLAQRGPSNNDQTQMDTASKDLPINDSVAALYELYRRKAGMSSIVDLISKGTIKSIITLAANAASAGLIKGGLEKSAAIGPAADIGSFVYPYVVGAHVRSKSVQGEKLGYVRRLFAEHTGLIGVSSLSGAEKLLSSKGKTASVSDSVRMNRVVTYPLVEDNAPNNLVDRAIVNGFLNL